MPKLQVDGLSLHYEDTGGGPETVLFSHGLLFSGRMFDAQVAALEGRYRCVTYDHRGQGRSEAPRGRYDMDRVYEDAVALIEQLKLAPVHFVGLSMGGFVGIRLGARRPELLRSLVLMETSAEPEPPENVPKYKRLLLASRLLGMRLLAPKVLPIMVGRRILEDPERAPELRRVREQLLEVNRAGLAGALSSVITRRSVLDELGRIRVPTLVMVGEHDAATVPDKARRIHAGIAGSRLVIIPGAGHSSSMEETAFVNAELDGFLAGVAGVAAGS